MKAKRKPKMNRFQLNALSNPKLIIITNLHKTNLKLKLKDNQLNLTKNQ